jgi:FAD/FMN-containing dehydrogenase
MKQLISGWGRYPVIDANVMRPIAVSQSQIICKEHSGFIPRGLGRSYGDSSLQTNVLDCTALNFFENFDSKTGLLTCGAGVSLKDILDVFLPQGWFLPVTPGTRWVTVAGAVASDVHGKNHHGAGTFSQHVKSIQILLGAGQILEVSSDAEPELFRATCGGMGLTGIILSVTLRLQKISSSNIIQTTIKANNLSQAMEIFENHWDSTYSVAWIDCMATNAALGRSLIMLGEHANDQSLWLSKEKPFSVPKIFPSQLLNSYSIKLFNTLYFNKQLTQQSNAVVGYKNFFYPLDGLSSWNNMYGRQGFSQYQLVLPQESGLEGLTQLLKKITASGYGSFLAVLKKFGPQNDNYLSFPISGYTLALDFKISQGALALMDSLDSMVLDYGGRLYLTKDVRMSEQTFKSSYPEWHRFEEVRERYGAVGKFSSLQSKRLGLQ